jgi:hypothetical protein
VISPSSNCCRVDAVKASVNQLKLQLAQDRHAGDDNSIRSANQQVQAAEAQTKSGDATKAELALSTARAAVETLLYRRHTATHAQQLKPAAYGNIDIRV